MYVLNWLDCRNLHNVHVYQIMIYILSILQCCQLYLKKALKWKKGVSSMIWLISGLNKDSFRSKEQKDEQERKESNKN